MSTQQGFGRILDDIALGRLAGAAVAQQRIATADIAKRTLLETSMMPAGLVNDLTITEFASLLDYLESLAQK